MAYPNPTEHFAFIAPLVGAVAYVVALAFMVAWPLVRFVVRHVVRLVVRYPVTVGALAVVVLAWLQHGPLAVALLAAAIVASGVVWRAADADSFASCVTSVVYGQWRRRWVYAWRWNHAMAAAKLTVSDRGTIHVPVLGPVRSDSWVDAISVRMVAGQTPEQWHQAAEGLAHAFRANACAVRRLRPGWIAVVFQHRDPLAHIVAPFEPRPQVNLQRVPIGIREDGRPWFVRLRGRNMLIVGAMGAGKGSIVHSLLRGIGPAIRSGLAAVWCADAKGGMELAPAQALFARFAYTAGDIVAMLEDAAELVQHRADRLRGVTRTHTPSTADPHIVVVLDEAAFITSYSDRDTTRRAARALAVILTQGRAVGFSLVAALQDPHKDVIPLRDLFAIRVCLRVTEPVQADMSLGDGAHNRGAFADRIPDDLPGVAYVHEDGHRDFARVRACWQSDRTIAETCRRWPAPTHANVVEVPSVEQPADVEPAGMAA